MSSANVQVEKYDGAGRLAEVRSVHNLVVDIGLNQLASISGTMSSPPGFRSTSIGSNSASPGAGDINVLSQVQIVQNTVTHPSLTQSVFSSSHTGVADTIRESALRWSSSTTISLARVTFSAVPLLSQDTLSVRWTVSFG